MSTLFPCYLCKQRLPRNAFYVLRGRSTGVSSGCKPCLKTNADHVVPLNGVGVCGLHVESNLRVVTRFVNRSKKNHYQSEVHLVK